MLIRKESHSNEFPERSGRRDIYAQRLGSFYRLKFVWYTDTQTYIRLYQITQEQFVSLVTYYGKQIDHSRLFDEYVITSNRSIFRLWVAKHNNQVNLMVRSPNNAEFPINGNLRKLQKQALSSVNWQMEKDTEGKRWLVTNFLIHKEHIYAPD